MTVVTTEAVSSHNDNRGCKSDVESDDDEGDGNGDGYCDDKRNGGRGSPIVMLVMVLVVIAMVMLAMVIREVWCEAQ